MKRFLLIIISVLSVLHAYAQDVDSLKAVSTVTTVDSLSLRLDKLQHDYDYLYCNFELYRLKSGLEDLTQDINIKTHDVIINVYHNRYNRELYTSHSNNYDACSALYDSYQATYSHLRTMVILKMVTSNFTETERNVIYSCLDSIIKSFSSVEAALNYYNTAIQTYRNKRWESLL